MGRFPGAALFRQRRCAARLKERKQFQELPPITLRIGSRPEVAAACSDDTIVCLDSHGKPQFCDLLFWRAEPACEHDLEGIVAKRKSDPYLVEHASWLRICNQAYSQWFGQEELFERERGSDPRFSGLGPCALACKGI